MSPGATRLYTNVSRGNQDEIARGEDDDDVLSVSDFQKDFPEQNADAFDDLEKDVKGKVRDGDRVLEKLANVLINRFTVKMPSQ